MPIFDFRCDTCAKTEEHFVHHHEAIIVCKTCGATKTKLFTSTPAVHVFPNGGIHLKNVCAGGKTFYSQGEMKRYAREHNMELGALL
jgi:putative FmdB family regulatory protein